MKKSYKCEFPLSTPAFPKKLLYRLACTNTPLVSIYYIVLRIFAWMEKEGRQGRGEQPAGPVLISRWIRTNMSEEDARPQAPTASSPEDVLGNMLTRMPAGHGSASAAADGDCSVVKATNRFDLSDEMVTSVSGSLAGFAATFAKQPIQRIKWIRQIDSGVGLPYHAVLRRTIQTSGIHGLFRGSVAGIMRNMPHSALVYTIYPKMERGVLHQQQVWRGSVNRREGSGGGSSSGGSSGDSSNSSSRGSSTTSGCSTSNRGSSTTSSGGTGSNAVAVESVSKPDFSTRFWAGCVTHYSLLTTYH